MLQCEKSKVLILLILIGLSSWSCSSDKSDYARIVSEWQGKEVVFPEVMTDLLTGDTIYLSDADFTILTYVDSAGCTGCKMKLPIWNEFIASLDTITDYNVNVLMIVNSDDEQEVRYLLKRDDYTHPVYMDRRDDANALNSFPADELFRTFLLDKSFNVIALGSPIHFPSISKLYKSIISGGRTLNLKNNQDIQVSENMINLSDLKPGETLQRKFQLMNNGVDTVYIDKIINSCDCMEVSAEGSVIPPKSRLNVKVQLTVDSTDGEFIRSTQIVYRGLDYPSIVNFKGNITTGEN